MQREFHPRPEPGSSPKRTVEEEEEVEPRIGRIAIPISKLVDPILESNSCLVNFPLLSGD